MSTQPQQSPSDAQPVLSLGDTWRIFTFVWWPLLLLSQIANPGVMGIILTVLSLPVYALLMARKARIPVGRIQRIGWRAALGEVQEELARRRRRHGMQARWQEAAAITGLTERGENDEQVPVADLIDVRSRDWGLELLFRANSDRTLRRMQDESSSLARVLRFQRVDFAKWKNPGHIYARGFDSDPLGGVREFRDQRDEDFPLTIGRLETGGDAEADLTDAAHVAIQGATRSGKSVMTYVLLGNLAGREDVRVCGADPSGLLLRPWATRQDAGPIAIGGTGASTDQELDNYVDLANWLMQEMQRRAAILYESGSDKISDFSKEMPLLIVVLEEYSGLIEGLKSGDVGRGTAKTSEGPKREPVFTAAVGRLLREGAKYGIRVLILTQRMDASLIGGGARSQLGMRITLRIDNSDGIRMLHEGVDSELVSQVSEFSPGQGIFQVPGQPVRVARFDLIDYGDYRRMVETAS